MLFYYCWEAVPDNDPIIAVALTNSIEDYFASIERLFNVRYGRKRGRYDQA